MVWSLLRRLNFSSNFFIVPKHVSVNDYFIQFSGEHGSFLRKDHIYDFDIICNIHKLQNL